MQATSDPIHGPGDAGPICDPERNAERMQGEATRATMRRMPVTPRILLSGKEAAEALGVSLAHFKRHIQPQVRCVFTGNLRRYLVKDIERWAEREATIAGQITPQVGRHQG